METNKFNSLVRLFSNYLSLLTCGLAYQSWTDELARRENIKLFEDLVDTIKDLNIVWDELTPLQASMLGFNKWEDGNNLFLIPLHVMLILKKTEPDRVLKDINGQSETVFVADCDVRFGVTAYGIELYEKEKEEIKKENK